jgi:hypothetical protein
MRALLLVACVIGLVVADARAASSTHLTVTYREDRGRPTQRVRWTVSCNPTGGTHPRRAAVCRELARVGWAAFRPVPTDTACAQIYGGPQVAIVSGRVGGRRVWARLTRADGCQIARWERLPSLLPPGGVR